MVLFLSLVEHFQIALLVSLSMIFFQWTMCGPVFLAPIPLPGLAYDVMAGNSCDEELMDYPDEDDGDDWDFADVPADPQVNVRADLRLKFDASSHSCFQLTWPYWETPVRK